MKIKTVTDFICWIPKTEQTNPKKKILLLLKLEFFNNFIMIFPWRFSKPRDRNFSIKDLAQSQAWKRKSCRHKRKAKSAENQKVVENSPPPPRRGQNELAINFARNQNYIPHILSKLFLF